MHEFSVVAELARIVEKEVTDKLGESRPVTLLEVRVGPLSCVNAEALRFAFEHIKGGTMLESAELVLRLPPLTGRCRACGSVTEIQDPFDSCGACGSPDVAAEGEEAVVLDRIELEDESE